MALHVREKPPLRLAVSAKTPSGNYYHWGEDERRATNVPSGLNFSTTMPGGFEAASATLPRKTDVAYDDLTRLSTLQVHGAGGQVAWEGRLERAPRQSGSSLAISPSAVGWQAHLDDNKSFREIYVDIDLNQWRGPSVARRVALAAYVIQDPSVEADENSTDQPALKISNNSTAWTASLESEAYYDALGIPIGSLYYAWKRGPNVNNADTNWDWSVISATDDVLSGAQTSGNLRAAGPGTGTLTVTGTTSDFVCLALNYAVAVASALEYALFWTTLAIYGRHGLTKQGSASATAAQGFYASDVIGHALSKGAPLLRYTTGTNGTIQATSFVIPQLAFKDPTTAAEVIKQANRFHLNDWAVWEGASIGQPTFYYNERGARGRSWRARIGPAQLQETGPQVDRLWNGVIVRYNDVSGISKTVGPTGSGADTISTNLEDLSSDNPVNQAGIRRWDVLDMNIVSTAAGATEVGRRFLSESNQLDRSGQATLVGTVIDDRGIERPAWQVRAGDTISFVDASDTSERRIVKTSYDHSSRTCSVDLDAPPEGMDALLERLGAVLVPLGL